jgi:hypothetical protein
LPMAQRESEGNKRNSNDYIIQVGRYKGRWTASILVVLLNIYLEM